MNRLKDATSPYLLQHADNPVDWWEWSDEAFAEARRRDVPVHLSVGYAACHWCHVMAQESFQDDEVARVMNELFVNIKVDREERPDVDAVYMEATQAMTGQGGWPMTVFMTPEGHPFYCGTYFPRAQFRAAAAGRPQGVDGPAGRGGRAGAAGRRRRLTPRAVEARGDAGARRGDARARREGAGRVLRRGARRVRERAEVPAVDDAGVPAAAPRADRGRAGALDGGAHHGGDGPRRHLRPARRRVRPVLGGRGLGRPALREDALRQRAARPGVRALVAARPGRRSRGGWRWRPATGCSATCGRTRAVSRRRWTPTARASRASTTCGRRRSSARCSARRTGRSRGASSR